MEKLIHYINTISPIDLLTKEKLSSTFQQTSLKKGDVFISAGDVEKRIGFLLKGVIRAFYRNHEGQEYNKHFFVEPCFFGGYSSLISGQPNLIIQECLTDCECLTTSYAALTRMYDQHQDLERFSRKLAELYFVQKEKREVELVLMEASERYEIFQKEYPDLEQLIPQYHIASYLGITPTQLSRIRRKLS